MTEYMDNEKMYVTADLYLTAYLKIKGFKYKMVKEKNKFKFTFDETEDLTMYVDEYLTESGSIEPLAYANAIKNIKNYIHSVLK
jgi:hypothetical protein